MFSPSAQRTTFAVGKFAGDAEFLRMDGGGAGAALDEWVNEATAQGYARRGDSWRLSFPMGSPIAFLWHPRQDREKDELLAGVIAPSRDAVGRDYPLAVVTRFSEKLVAEAPHAVPLAFGNFLDAAYEAIAEARAKPMPFAAFAARVGVLAPPTAPEVATATGMYEAWCAETAVAAGWATIFGADDPLTAADHAVSALRATLGSGLPGRTPFVTRLPLGTGGPAAAVLWLDIVRRLFRRLPAPPSAFWGVDDASLVLAFEPMPPRVLAELWSPSPGSPGGHPQPPAGDETFDVLRAVREAGGIPRSQRSGSGDPFSGSGTMRAWLGSLGR